MLSNNGQGAVIYLKLSNTFDRINRYILLLQLEKIGFSQIRLTFLSFCLYYRSYFIAYSGYFSSVSVALNEVPQGSNLGPMPFLLFLNENNCYFCDIFCINFNAFLLYIQIKYFYSIFCMDRACSFNVVLLANILFLLHAE